MTVSLAWRSPERRADDGPYAKKHRREMTVLRSYGGGMGSTGCPGADSNRDAFRHYPLKIACLPVSPPGRAGQISRGKPVSQPQLRTLLMNGLPLIWDPPSRISISSSPVNSGV